MKILAIGDFHGKFPKKLKEKIKDVDLIVSIGDYMPFSLKKQLFKHVYRSDKELWEVLGKEAIKKAELRDIKEGEKILEFLNKQKPPVITVSGNLDRAKWKDATDYKLPKWKWVDQDFFTPLVRKFENIKCFDYSYIRVKNYVFIGMARSTFPGKVKSKEYKRQRKILEKLFKKFSKENKENRVIFVSHNVPYNTKIDLIKDPNADKKARGKHFGSKLVRRLIEKYQPLLSIAGHIHESQGKDKIKNTTAINTGSVLDGEAAVIELDEEKGKVKKIRFL